MPQLVRALSNQVGRLINYTELAGRINLSRQTMLRYMSLLKQLFIFENLPAWHSNRGKRITKTPKLHIVDTGLWCALTRINKDKLMKEPDLFGFALESYVFCELRRQSSWQSEPLYFYHYRDKDKTEVDLVIETISGAVIGIEIKASATLKNKDFDGLKKLKDMAGKDFLMGIVLYDGDHTNEWNQNIYSVPIGAIWI